MDEVAEERAALRAAGKRRLDDAVEGRLQDVESAALAVSRLADPEELEGIREDMQEEGAKYGPLLKVVIPQGPPAGSGGALPPGYLKVFLQYGDVAAAGRARQAMAGRKFGGKVVEAVFVDEEMFRQGAL